MNPSKIKDRKYLLSKLNLTNRDIPKSDKEELSNQILPLTNLDLTNKNKEIISRDILARLPAIHIEIKMREPIKYDYDLSNLKKDRVNFKSDKLIHLCIYKIINKPNLPPFIMYLLNKIDKVLYFPHFRTTEIIEGIADNNINKLYENYNTKPDYIGYKETKNNIYIFYKSNIEHELWQINYADSWWYVTIDEIMNNHKILNFDIHRTVYSLFYKYVKLASLFTKNSNCLPVPIIGYYGAYSSYIAFIASFGLPKETPTSILGPYYYFYTYKGAGRRAIWTQSRKQEVVNDEEISRNEYGVHKRGGIVRFAVFGDNIKFFLNREGDMEDQSEISQIRAKDTPFIKATLKIRDVDGNWAISNNLAYIGSTYIDFEGNPHKGRKFEIQWAARDYFQYLSLSYHYVNTDEFMSLTNEEAKTAPFEYKDYLIE
tara:strand:+ start:20055 stop:21341 length:1287 start_codon:yes stop_codon:yes gene_type:complete